MAAVIHRALVVDDEEPIRKLVAFSLRKMGYQCELAADGEEAMQLFANSKFDVVVTDLKMPNKNGHALALDLLQQEVRPLIMVYTGVIEPRLAKDLLARGVDDIVYKPLDFSVLAAKVSALVERRSCADTSQQEAKNGKQTSASDFTPNSPPGPINFSQLNAKLAELSTVLPVSKTALDVYHITRGDDWQVSQVAAAIQRDGSLAADVLRIANSSLYNRSGRRLINLDEAVMRIGQNRIGELALTSNLLAALTPGMLPWLDVELTWKRSMAAGVVVESLIEMGSHRGVGEGLLLSAIMQPLGRVALGMLFPKLYEAMIRNCGRSRCTLQEEERNMFPTNHAEVMAHLLSTWRIAANVFLPLKFSLDDYAALAQLSEPTRTRAELVKVAILIGRLAVGHWEAWDVVRLPPPSVLKRLRLKSVQDIVRQTRHELDQLADIYTSGQTMSKKSKTMLAVRPVAYCNVGERDDDLFAELLPSLGFEPQIRPLDCLHEVTQPCIINCLSMPAARFAARGADSNTVIVSNEDDREVYACLAPTIALPSSYARIREFFRNEFKKKLPSHSRRPTSA
jgi:CheY-like chemotaxis protein/HD-like signal output (HDOD) protein